MTLKDPLEIEDLINDEKKINEINRFRAAFKSEESKILNHHLSFIKKRMIETIGKGVKKIALVQINNDKILDLCRRAAEELNIEINNVVSDLKLTNEGRPKLLICAFLF